MTEPPSSKDPDVIPEWALTLGRLLGWSPVQTRWKLTALIRRWRAFRSELAPASSRFENQICGSCGAIQPHEAKTCSSCGGPLASGAARVMRSLGLSIPTFLSVSSLLGLAIIVIYFRMMMTWKGQGFMSWDTEALVAHGALYPAAFRAGQWWRIGTANFLHIGVLHVFFNIMALSQVGPTIEEVFGRSRMIFFFALTGVLAMLASAILQPHATTAGASGALMGLIGVAAGWGHRSRTSQGIAVRNMMIQWGIYTMLFGLLVHANHVAHAGGFVIGALLGLAYPPHTLEATKGSALSIAMGIAGTVACCGFVLLTLAPPPSSWAYAAKLKRDAEMAAEFEPTPEEWSRKVDEPCKFLDAGERDKAEESFRELVGPDADIDVDEVLVPFCAHRKLCETLRTSGPDALLTKEEAADPKIRERRIHELYDSCGGGE